MVPLWVWGVGAAVLTALIAVCAMDWVEDLVGGLDFRDDDEE